MKDKVGAILLPIGLISVLLGYIMTYENSSQQSGINYYRGQAIDYNKLDKAIEATWNSGRKNTLIVSK